MLVFNGVAPQRVLSGLVAGDSAICGLLAAQILRLRPAGLRFEEFRSPVKRGGLGLRFSNRSGLRPAAIVDVSDIFYFFCWGRGRGVRGDREGAGSVVFN